MAGTYVAGQPPAAVEDALRRAGASEFTLPSMETYAIVDLVAAR